MPSGVYKRTSPAWNKGKKWSEDHKKKLSIAHLGKKSPHIGVPRTPETRKKISNSMKGLIKSKETRLNLFFERRFFCKIFLAESLQLASREELLFDSKK